MDATRIKEALSEASGDVATAAGALGMPRRSLDRWIQRNGLREQVRAANPNRRKGVGGCPPGTVARKQPRRVSLPDPSRRVRVERECEAGSAFVSLADTHGNMVTIKFVSCSGGSTKSDGRGRLAELIQKPGGQSQTEFIAAEIQATSADERKRRTCLEQAIARVCGPELAVRIQEEARKCA